MGVSNMAFCQNKQLEKQRSKMYKAKIKEYKKEGWKLDSSSCLLYTSIQPMPIPISLPIPVLAA